MTQTKEFSYPSSDGVHTIHAQEWFPQSSPIAVIQIVHGVAEHIGRYQHLAQFLTAYGFVVCGEDHLGHGLTVNDGRYGYFAPAGMGPGHPRCAPPTGDRGGKVPRSAPCAAGPLHGLLPHSDLSDSLAGNGGWSGSLRHRPGKGALSGLRSASRRGLAALKGPDYVSPLIYELSLGAYNKKFQPARTRADWLSRDRDMVDANLNDPLCAFQPTVSMFRDMMEGLQFIASKKIYPKWTWTPPSIFCPVTRTPWAPWAGGYGRWRRCSAPPGAGM